MNSLTLGNEPRLKKLLRNLRGISRIEKCSDCSCLIDTIEEFRWLAKDTALEKDVDDFANTIRVSHGCLGCSTCYPANVSNSLYDMAGAMVKEKAEPRKCPSPDTVGPVPSRSNWPVAIGDYLIISPSARVAVSTLGSEDLPEEIAKTVSPKSVAIVAKTETENIGIEKIIQNTVSNPNIRFLLMCGKDSRGHLPGQTILALAQNGIEAETHKVIGSLAKRPVLRNVTEQEIEQFLKQVSVVDLIGTVDVSEILVKIQRLIDLNLPVYPPSTPPQETAQRVIAHPPDKTRLDKSGFFIIYIDKTCGRLILEHYHNDGNLNIVIEGEDSASLYSTALELNLTRQLDHAAYLGKELGRAEDALKYGIKYVQDAAPGQHTGT